MNGNSRRNSPAEDFLFIWLSQVQMDHESICDVLFKETVELTQAWFVFQWFQLIQSSSSIILFIQSVWKFLVKID